MKNKSVHISIAQPCHEDWAKMSAGEKGAFCHSCRKEVVDFSSMTDREVIAYLAQHSSGCGRFRPDQLNSTLHDSQLKNGFLKWRALFLSFLSLISIRTIVTARGGAAAMHYDDNQKPKQDTIAAQSQTQHLLGDYSCALPNIDTVTMSQMPIRGTISNERGVKLQGAKIALLDSNGVNSSVQTVSDTEGNFSLTIKTSAGKQKERIRISYLNQPRKTISLNNDSIHPLSIVIDDTPPMIMGKIAVRH